MSACRLGRLKSGVRLFADDSRVVHTNQSSAASHLRIFDAHLSDAPPGCSCVNDVRFRKGEVRVKQECGCLKSERCTVHRGAILASISPNRVQFRAYRPRNCTHFERRSAPCENLWVGCGRTSAVPCSVKPTAKAQGATMFRTAVRRCTRSFVTGTVRRSGNQKECDSGHRVQQCTRTLDHQLHPFPDTDCTSTLTSDRVRTLTPACTRTLTRTAPAP